MCLLSLFSSLLSQLLGSLPTMATLVTSFLLLLVILGNNQASPVPGDYPLEPEGPPDSNGYLEDLWEAEPLTLKRQKRGNDAQWLDNYLDNYVTPWMDRENYDSNVDWADARQDFNPQIVGKHKGK